MKLGQKEHSGPGNWHKYFNIVTLGPSASKLFSKPKCLGHCWPFVPIIPWEIFENETEHYIIMLSLSQNPAICNFIQSSLIHQQLYIDHKHSWKCHKESFDVSVTIEMNKNKRRVCWQHGQSWAYLLMWPPLPTFHKCLNPANKAKFNQKNKRARIKQILIGSHPLMKMHRYAYDGSIDVRCTSLLAAD